ncbi:hypothetical protein RclHR1_00330020 [Rhizophagus clarus]|uniref:BTB domain-containing protein n=1 Tax=Rhizophagus clarus TaxID=94130 RepID=A0A2Z6R925_9GLOM|nr:hypothetical protein RclHR1_00330020 [Rhizophagus clarus]GES81733.1 hypothetical protein GLOIN_2v1778225 [Rhizophagus clarus]
MVSKFHSSLSEALSLMLNDSDDHDVIIQVGENQNIKEFRAHSNILKARSPYFKGAFSAGWISKKDNIIEFRKPNINPTVFEMILKYIYTGEVDLTKAPGENILGLLVASDELLLEELLSHVQGYLIENQSTWIEKNFVLVLHTVFKLASCKKLQDHCLESICDDPQPFITSKDFPSLDKDILYGLLKRDDLNIEEIVAWDYLIKWGIQQTPGLGSRNNNRTKWNNKNYEALKKTLNKFIPLIRFTAISSADFFDKVRPYKAVIPYHIYEEAMEFYMKDTMPKTTTLPPRVGRSQIESNLIKPKLTRIIAGWIERKNGNNLSLNKKYKFDLLYRGSQDGINYSTCRNKCNNQGPCLVLVKHQQSSEIYGGYNPLGFMYCGNQWRNTSESFIFSFETGEDIKNMKISRVNSNYYNCAIYECNSYGFSFGNNLYMNSNSNIYFSNTGYYDDNVDNVLNPYQYTNFWPEEIEVFKITTS